ncbi:MAG: type II toxin-antitoxin system VapC family toxin [Methylococcaceae bacterium]|nr:type II toxin-antitoxin system VapC family toxin [Methylococcaceae bacterium]MDP3904797.1 type II toxin-antitoxin system VapC family toxin [Methylococcaceae bacterium]
MKSVDTNILVRYYAQDDALQSPLALRIFSDEPELFVTKTVLLEFFWVLTQAEKFRFPAEQVMTVFEHLQDLPNITIEDELSLRTAITWCRAGLEFPDALHLAASGACSAFLTFDDRKFARRAQSLKLTPVCEIPA